MIYTIPHYYKKFHCIASECPDTCCAGWEIMIDKKTLEHYRRMEGPFGNRLHNSIHWNRACFKQYEGRGAFLNENDLCDIYGETGAANLCRTCRTYPRHIEEFEGCREISLCMSCIEAAKLILGCEEPVRFITKEDERQESYEDFDFFLYTKLMDARELAISILQERTLDINVRMAMCLALAHDMQGRIGRNRLFETDALLERYRGKNRNPWFVRKMKDFSVLPDERWELMQNMYGIIGRFEVLKQDWPGFAKQAGRTLYGEGGIAYGRQRAAFRHGPLEAKLPLWEEQLMVYFVFTYFCGAVYHGNPYGKMKLAVVSTLLIGELAQAVWKEKGGTLDFLDFVDVAHRYSREVEHSDLNKRRLEQGILEKPAFSLDKLMRATAGD